MKTLPEGTTGTTYTVRKITGGRPQQQKLEALGIASGADLTLLSTPEAEPVRFRLGSRELELPRADAATIVIDRHFKREGDPMLMSSCCSGGNACGLWDRINEENPEA